MIDKSKQQLLVALLKDIKTLENGFENAISSRFNIFEAIGLVKQEIRHSTTLAYFLSPNEKHGLQDSLIREILTDDHITQSLNNQSSLALKIALANFDDLSVRREDMRIDIIAESPANKIIVVIENKVDATEGRNQLIRYKEIIESDKRYIGYQKLFLYLTPDGDEPSDPAWIAISYKLIADSLDYVYNKKKKYLSHESTLILNHYVELIRRYILQEIDEEFREACLILYGNHRAILDEIKIIIDASGSRSEAISQFIENHKELVINGQTKEWLSFNPKELFENMPDVVLTRTWHNQNKPIVFFFDLKSDRIKLVLEVGPMSDQTMRENLVKSLFKNVLSQDKGSRSGIYTRVWTTQYRVTQGRDISDLEIKEVLDEMNKLFSIMISKKDNIGYSIKEVFFAKSEE